MTTKSLIIRRLIMMSRGFIVVVLVLGVVLPDLAQAGSARPRTKVVGEDPADDWGGSSGELAPLGDAIGQELTKATITPTRTTIDFTIYLKSLPPSGGVPEFSRYLWGLEVDGDSYVLDGRFTNLVIGTCHPVDGSCPPPNTTPRVKAFEVRGECGAGTIGTVCELLGFVEADFDSTAASIRVAVPRELIGAARGSVIGSDTHLMGNGVVAVPAIGASATVFPFDHLAIGTTVRV